MKFAKVFVVLLTSLLILGGLFLEGISASSNATDTKAQTEKKLKKVKKEKKVPISVKKVSNSALKPVKEVKKKKSLIRNGDNDRAVEKTPPKIKKDKHQ